MRYQAMFTGRRRGSIGIMFSIRTIVEAPDESAAHERLYLWFEDLMCVRLTSTTDTTTPEGTEL